MPVTWQIGAAVLGLLLGGPAAAQTADPAVGVVLHLTQQAERTVTRDVLHAELRVEETAADPRTVQAAVNRRMDAARGRAKQVQGVRAETGSYFVAEERPANGPSHWRGGQSLVLSGKDAGALLELAGALQSDGLAMSSLRYDVSTEAVRALEGELTAEALAALDRRAAAVARDMQLSVLRYRDVRVGNAETEGRPMPRLAMAAMAVPAPVAEPGETQVRVTVEADLLLGPVKQ